MYKKTFARYGTSADPAPVAPGKMKYVADIFTQIAPRYDLLNRLLSLGLDSFWRKELVRASSLKEGQTVLDVATGTGDQLAEFQRMVPGIRGCGIDQSKAMLDRAAPKLDSRRFSLRLGDALRLPWAKKSFDACTMAFVLRSLPDPLRAFKEMRRVTRAGGRILCLEFSAPSNRFIHFGYFAYLKLIPPVLGAVISGHPSAYRYLSESIQGFHHPEKVVGFMRRAGLKDAEARPLMLGIVTLYIARS
jgi:demethylmenaquinone methyltransferase / 2-methoxy-6-polyprenyl-1,4-benzoquinol methylase